MVYRDDERKIEEALIKGTEEAELIKDRVWENIEERLDFNRGREIKVKQKRKGFIKYGAIAAALVLVLLTNTQYGNAAVDSIKKLFAPKKTVVQQLEGTGEKTEMDLHASQMKYIIYVDKSMYKMERVGDKDIIKPINQAKGYPEVSMTIEQISDKKPEIAASEMEKTLKKEFKTVQNKGKVTDPIKAILLTGKSGNQSKSTIVRYYFIDNTKGGTFIVAQKYFLEAEEGHGARFYHMLKEFKIVKE